MRYKAYLYFDSQPRIDGLDAAAVADVYHVTEVNVEFNAKDRMDAQLRVNAILNGMNLPEPSRVTILDRTRA